MGKLKHKWTDEEEKALLAGIKKHGAGKWRIILNDPEFAPFLTLRSNVDLKVPSFSLPFIFLFFFQSYFMFTTTLWKKSYPLHAYMHAWVGYMYHMTLLCYGGNQLFYIIHHRSLQHSFYCEYFLIWPDVHLNILILATQFYVYVALSQSNIHYHMIVLVLGGVGFLMFMGILLLLLLYFFIL